MSIKQIIGDCTLYLGDSLEIMAGLQDESVDLVWTDPPYGNENNAKGFSTHNDKRGHSTLWTDGSSTRKGDIQAQAAIQNDDQDSMRRVIDGTLVHASRILKKDFSAACYCSMGGGAEGNPSYTWIAERMNRKGMTFFHQVIWDKKNPGTGWRYRRQHELIIVGMREGSKIAWPGGGTSTNPGSIANIISISKPRRYGETHPNDKPPELVRKFLAVHTAPGDVVIDPFMGGGATGIACIQMNRKFIGIELDPKYFDLACANIEKASRQGALPLPDVKPVQEGLAL